jgi:hypothetical protein
MWEASAADSLRVADRRFRVFFVERSTYAMVLPVQAWLAPKADEEKK